jgi:ribosomal protein S12 methylthiotransferase accessory factor
MAVGLAGEGPAAEAVRAALADVDAAATATDPGRFTGVEFGVVVGTVGDGGFRTANVAAREGETPWVAVELGGVGGRGVEGVTAAVSGYAPGTACFECLRTRVAANADVASAGGAGEANATDGDGTGDAADERGTDATDARFAGALAGREVARLLSGGESPVLGGVLELPHARRHLLPVPGCDCGGAPDRRVRRDHAPREVEGALARAERALDPRVGIVHEAGEAESFPAPYYLATLAATTGFSDAAVPEHAAGVAADWNPAFVKALGESLERYAAAVYRTGAMATGPAGAVANAVPPSAFVTADSFAPPDPQEPIAWVEGEDLHDGSPAHLPAEFVVFPPPEARHRPSITTGLGLGSSGVGALLSGLYETIERDAAMLAWYSSYEPLGLEVESEGFETLARRARSEDLETTVLLLTQDVDVPVVAACVHREGEWPRFAAGMAADLDPERAATSALEEAVQNWLELRGMGPEGARAEGNIGEYAGFPEPVREFVDPATTVPAGSVGPVDPPTGTGELDAVLDRLDDANLRAFAARLTTRDLEELGFEAVRVLVPAAQPLFTGEAFFGERAREVPKSLGFEPRLEREPHPFP